MKKYGSYFIQYLAAIVIVSLVCFLFYNLTNHVGYRVVSFILLFCVSIMAAFLRPGPILAASTLSALFWNYFFIPPTHTFQTGTAEDSFMLGMFFLIALVNGILTSRIRRQEQMTRDREERTHSLFELTSGLSQAAGLNDVIRVASADLKRIFYTDVIFILPNESGTLRKPQFDHKGMKIGRNEMTIATWCHQNGQKGGKFTSAFPKSGYTFFPLAGPSVKPGVAVAKLSQWFTGYQELQWNTFLSLISVAIEREFLDDLAKRAQILDESDKLYRTLFNTISHELRIPVATIMGATDTLLNPGHTEEVRKELTQEIYKASERLNRLIENLLNMSRLESGRIRPRMDWCDVHDLINRVTQNLRAELASFHLIVTIPDKMPLVKLDFGLMETILNNLVYNACQYAGKDTNLRIRTSYEDGNLVMQVLDRGPGFSVNDIPFVFDKFYRVKGSKAGGTGLGLSIVKGFVEAQKGSVTVENRKNGGARFTIKIQSAVPQIDQIIKNAGNVVDY